MLPLVSAIIPAYNAEKTIEDCINSIINQTYNNIEIIVVNDGSTDSTINILNRLTTKIKNLTIFTISNSGPSKARNLGIQHAHGEYIAFLDSDDKWLPDKINMQVNYLINNPSIAVLGCKASIGKSIKLNDNKKLIKISPLKMLLKNHYSTPCVIIKKGVLEKYQFNIARKYAEDYLLWLTIVFNNYKCYTLNQTLVELADKQIFGESGLSSKLWEMEKGELFNFQQLFKEKKISLMVFYFASLFSLIKYFRRVLICKVRKSKQ